MTISLHLHSRRHAVSVRTFRPAPSVRGSTTCSSRWSQWPWWRPPLPRIRVILRGKKPPPHRTAPGPCCCSVRPSSFLLPSPAASVTAYPSIVSSALRDSLMCRSACSAFGADDFAEIAHAAVDRGDDRRAGNRVRVQHRSLFDVNLDEADDSRAGSRLQRVDVRHAFAVRPAWRIASRIVTPSASRWSSQPWSELADDRARAEKGRPVALAFFFGKADRLRGRKAGAGRARCSSRTADHRHQDAEPAVVLATIAHGVEMRPGQEPFRLRIGRVVGVP